MKLRTKILLLYSCGALLITAFSAGILYTKLWEDRRHSIQEDIFNQLQHIDFALNNFFSELENDLDNLASNKIVRSRDDGHFTNFLEAEEETFRYDIRPLEREIVAIFNAYRMTHPYVNSVYMGRENGSFVRSHNRERPTRYDPRDRPWYILAKRNQGKVVHTDAYSSVTAPDINIGTVKALVDEKGVFYGVVGADVTLDVISRYIANFRVSPAGRIFLTDGTGVVLASEDKTMHFKNIRSYSPELHRLLAGNGHGTASLEIRGGRYYACYQTSFAQNWKIAILIAKENIDKEIVGSVIITVVGFSLGLLVLSAIMLIGLHYVIVKPLHRFIGETNYVKATSNLDRRIEIHSRDEIGQLAASFNEMIGALDHTHRSLEAAGEELRTHRDHLEELVKERTLRLAEANRNLSTEIGGRIKREEELRRALAELAAAKERAEAADRLKSSFLATMSHELRTPLNSIIGFTGIILRERVGPLNDEQKKQLNMVRRSSQHLLSLINDVLDISKIEAGQLKVAQESVDLRPLIEKAVQSTRPLADAKGIELTHRIAVDAPAVTGDPRRVEQVLLNLLSNAIKFTEKGSVAIVCEADGDAIIVRVIDTGIGIKAEDRETIFQSFRQIDSGLSRKHEGTGLGLSISKKIVELMGGRIWATSTWGMGSTFAFSLPKYR